MTPDYFRLLYDYTCWARDRVLAVVLDMPEDDYRQDVGFSYGSVQGILAHCFGSERGWRSRLQGTPARWDPPFDEVAHPEMLRALWSEEEASMRDFLARLTPAILAGDVTWVGSDGIARRLPDAWLTLTHVINHSTQHRSEAAEALTMLGRSPGDLDLGTFASERLRR